MPDLSQLVDLHGTVRRCRVELVVEHSDGFVHKIASAPITNRVGMTADDVHREMIKTAQLMVMANISTDGREKRARSRR